MSQIDVDQRNTNALIATAIMYQKQRNDLLALLSEIDEALAEWKNFNYINYGSSLMPSRFDSQLERIELRIEETIAAAKGEK